MFNDNIEVISLEIRDRKEIEEKYKWDLGSLYKSEESWTADFEATNLLLTEAEKCKGSIGDSPSSLLNIIEKSLSIYRNIQGLYVYAKMKLDEDTTSSKYQEMVERAEKLSVKGSEKLSFIVPELLKMDECRLKEYMEEDKLKLYGHYVDDMLRQKPHILGEAEEMILASIGDISSTPQNVFSMLNNADLKFPEIEDENGNLVRLTHGNYIKFMESKNRQVRKSAFSAMYETYGELKNTFAAVLNGEVKKNVMMSKLRKYDSPLHASLSDNNIPVDVYENLIGAVGENLDKMYRYIDLRKKELDLDEIHMYDLYTPMVKAVDFEIGYEDAKTLLLEGLKDLGEDYIEIVDEGLRSGWIDVYENKGKRSGAYSWGTYDSNPYIMMNYQSNLNSLFTLAHEMGHSVHSYYTRKTQPYVYGSYSIFLAEIASTVNESLLINHMIGKETDRDKKKYLLNHYLEQFRGTVFRQTMFAEFELKIHSLVEQGGALTREVLDNLYLELNKKYYGEDIVLDEGIEREWQKIPHMYYDFYVFQYATGYSAAASFTKSILEGKEGALESYKSFLKSGSSDYPIDILKKAGIDMTSPEPVKEALELFDRLLDMYESLI